MTPYIFSFCAHNENEPPYKAGLLSQWRGYGADGGFAIEFDSRVLEELLEREGGTCSHSGLGLSSVVYGEASPEYEFLRDRVEQVADVARTLIPHVMGIGGEEPDIEDTYLPFTQSIVRMKHPGFSEECEVRLVYIKPEDDAVPESKPPAKKISFRHRSGGRVPYVCLFHELENRLPIKRIIVGPHPKAQQRQKSLQLFLAQEGINTDVEVSSIPYLPE